MKPSPLRRPAALALCALLGWLPGAACRERALPQESAGTGGSPPATLGDAGAAGGVEGDVTLVGKAPPMLRIDRSGDPACVGKASSDEQVLASGGKLRNVVVRVSRGARPDSPPAEAAVVDQVGCTYRPRVQAAVVGQRLRVKNSDRTVHNVHLYLERRTLLDRGQPPRAPDIEKIASVPGVLTFKCDVHPWMIAHVVVTENAHVATTRDDGAYRLDGLPPGTYTLEAWHERYGAKTAEVTVVEGRTARVDFAFGP